jgi:hypothetical protein
MYTTADWRNCWKASILRGGSGKSAAAIRCRKPSRCVCGVRRAFVSRAACPPTAHSANFPRPPHSSSATSSPCLCVYLACSFRMRHADALPSLNSASPVPAPRPLPALLPRRPPRRAARTPPLCPRKRLATTTRTRPRRLPLRTPHRRRRRCANFPAAPPPQMPTFALSF